MRTRTRLSLATTTASLLLAFSGTAVGFAPGNTDDDTVPDGTDACPTIAGTRPDGCPEVQLKGKKVSILTTMTLTSMDANCPKKARVVVRYKSGSESLTSFRTLPTTASDTGCVVEGSVTLLEKPKKSKKTKVNIHGKNLVKKKLTAVRL